MNERITAAFEKERKRSAKQVRILYSWVDTEDNPVTNAIYAIQLQKDWHGECDYCPPNDTQLTALCIGTTLIPEEALPGFTFEMLMELIEQTCNFKRGRRTQKAVQ